MDFSAAIRWRYATKRMNGKRINNEKVERILEAMTLAPTSMGMQPFSVVVIDDEVTKNKIAESACKQPQIKESSHVLVIATWENYTEEQVDAYLQNVATTRSLPLENLAGFKTSILGFLSKMSVDEKRIWAQKQAYIALGFGLVAAATEEVDSTPMEGFDPEALDEVIGLKALGMHSAVVLTLGYRDEENDHLVHAKKVRRDIRL